MIGVTCFEVYKWNGRIKGNHVKAWKSSVTHPMARLYLARQGEPEARCRCRWFPVVGGEEVLT
ncbi:hypothetical protein SLEP1_g17974 [Rubroshorea leprosula]|uniref:Uncharacterized protein n=1 Tax=Rubroshorea leprosula TaxID=152421 RepID=A0AAV5J1U2_9ROSI|nr:hypothetical protein SLEP1_g17974 [Rubroshorea leprosula]